MALQGVDSLARAPGIDRCVRVTNEFLGANWGFGYSSDENLWQTKETEMADLGWLTVQAAANIRSGLGIDSSLEESEVVFANWLRLRPEVDDVCNALYLDPCFHSRTTDLILLQSLARDWMQIAAEGGFYVMTDIHGYGRGFHHTSDGETILVRGQIELLAPHALRLLQESSNVKSVLSSVSLLRHHQQKALLSYLSGLERIVYDRRGRSYRTNGDGIVAILPHWVDVLELARACALRDGRPVSGVGVVSLDACLSREETFARAEFAVGLTKLLIAGGAPLDEPVLYGTGPLLGESLSEATERAPAKTGLWVRRWKLLRPQDFDSVC